MQERILAAAGELFGHFGFSKTTADEIALKAGVSKRTLYKYCDNKRSLLDAYIEAKLTEIRDQLSYILQQNMDFSEKLRHITTQVAMSLSGLSSHFLEDLQRSVPEVWERISGFRREMVHTYFPKLLDEGIKTGHFKKNINKGIAVILMMHAMEIIIQPSWVSSLPDDLAKDIPNRPDALFDAIIEMIYEGIHTGETLIQQQKLQQLSKH